MTLKPGDVIGHYRIVELVGRGGMASVYRAYQESLKRQVAIKVLPDFFADDPDFRERFTREGEAIARLRHPNIVTVFDVGEENSVPYIVTEFLEGDPLSRILGKPVTVADAVALLAPLAAALDYAHSCGVIHRDVKPSNIILGKGQVPILTDFGLARITGSLPRLTRTGTPLGTPEYMAPEEASGDVGGAPADRYALAVIAYEMLTGTVPFSGDAPLAVLLAHISRSPPSPARINPAIGYAAEDVLLKGLAKAPDDRYPSATGFVDALRETVVDSPLHTASPHRQEAPPDRQRPASPTGAHHPTAASSAPSPLPSQPPRGEAAGAALQHAPTVMGIAVAAVALIYLLLVEPVAGFAAVAYGLLGAAGLVAVASFTVGYRTEYQSRRASLESLRERERQRSEDDLQVELRETLRSGFVALEAKDALRVLDELSDEHSGLAASLARHASTDLLSISLVPALADDAYRRGLNCLVDALELMSATSRASKDRLQREVAALETEVASLGADSSQAERLRIREATLDSHRARLRKHHDLNLRAEQLVFEAQRCEASLDQARTELAAIRVGASESGIDAVIDALKRTIDQAKEVQDEIKQLGY